MFERRHETYHTLDKKKERKETYHIWFHQGRDLIGYEYVKLAQPKRA